MRPDQAKIALTLADGSLAVMGLVTRGYNADGSVQFEREATPEAVEEEIAKAGLDVQRWQPIADEDVPADRTYRNAWTLDRSTGSIVHDMPKARDIHRGRIRARRAKLLAELDVDIVRALEQGKPTKDIAARKQRLRDAPADPRIEAAQTLEELAAVDPLEET